MTRGLGQDFLLPHTLIDSGEKERTDNVVHNFA
jgi:hypothetical protein